MKKSNLNEVQLTKWLENPFLNKNEVLERSELKELMQYFYNQRYGMTNEVKKELNEIFTEMYNEYDSLIPKLKRIKTHVLTFSPKFLKGHPREGEETFFIPSIKSGGKNTTCRGNYKLWSKRIDEVNNGNAVISLRYWSKKPFASPQIEFKIITKAIYMPVRISAIEKTVILDGVKLKKDQSNSFILNEGFLNVNDFWEWFEGKEFEGIYINFKNQ